MISALLIFNSKGEVLINSILKNNVKRSLSDVFRVQVINNFDIRSPILTLGSTSFIHTKYEDLWFVSVTRSNVDSSILIEFMYKFIDILRQYVGYKEDTYPNCIVLNEDCIRDNFIIINELIDHMLQFGYPVETDISVLRSLTSQKPNHDIIDFVENKSPLKRNKTVSKINLGLQSWRPSGIKYKKNEVYVDIIEKVNLMVSSTGTILGSDIDGVIQLNASLSGIPECHLRLDDAAEIQDCKFHQCVNLTTYDQTGDVKFVPPDGEFQLMSYKISQPRIPFLVLASITDYPNDNSRKYNVSIKSKFPSHLTANEVEVTIPTPNSIKVESFTNTSGKLKPKLEEGVALWTTDKFPGGETEQSASITVKVGNLKSVDLPPLSLQFSIPNYSTFESMIKFFKVHEQSGYKTTKYVRYFTKAGSYDIRY
ncbi:hypothetical protein LJB42_004283 [Komagataella kurtzmanii]|nr:hypothetical protein LJB42_004283 [Komagataella kurtzmanii]